VVLSGRKSVAVGERVTFSVTDVCGGCDRCAGGPQQKCRNLLKYGHIRHSSDSVPLGCYSTHILLGAGTAVVPLPPQLDTVLATPVNCALATMVAARKCARQGLARYSGEKQERKVLIFGGGLLGLYGCSLFKEDGFQVFLSDKSSSRKEQATQFGAERVTEEEIKQNQYDAVIEVCGVSSVVPLGLSLLKPGGVVVLVGCVTPDTKLDITGDQVIRKCATLMGVHNYEQEDLFEAVDFLTRTPYQGQFRTIISQPVPLSKFEDALQLARTMKYHRVLLDTSL